MYSLRKHPRPPKPLVCKQFDTFPAEWPLFYRLVPIKLATAANHVEYLAGVSICVYPAPYLPPFLVYTGLGFQSLRQTPHSTHSLPLFFPVWNLLLPSCLASFSSLPFSLPLCLPCLSLSFSRCLSLSVSVSQSLSLSLSLFQSLLSLSLSQSVSVSLFQSLSHLPPPPPNLHNRLPTVSLNRSYTRHHDPVGRPPCSFHKFPALVTDRLSLITKKISFWFTLTASLCAYFRPISTVLGLVLLCFSIMWVSVPFYWFACFYSVWMFWFSGPTDCYVCFCLMFLFNVTLLLSRFNATLILSCFNCISKFCSTVIVTRFSSFFPSHFIAMLIIFCAISLWRLFLSHFLAMGFCGRRN